MIKKNMNTIDRILRALIGIFCIWAGFVNTSLIANDILSMLVGLFGIINIGSALFAHCPVYLLAGLSTLRKTSNDSDG